VESMAFPSAFRYCEKCKTNTPAILNLPTQRSFTMVKIQDTFATLESSARDGCDLCSLLWQGLTYSTATPTEYLALQNSQRPVMLQYTRASSSHRGWHPNSRTDNFIVTCVCHHKWLMHFIGFSRESEDSTPESTESLHSGPQTGELHP